MSQGNVEIVREGLHSLLLTGQLPEDEMDPNFELRDHDLPDAAGVVYRGEEGFRDWLSQWAEAFGESIVEPDRYVDAGDRVVAVLKLTATGASSGAQVKREDGMVWTFEHGRVVRIDYYGSAEEALQAAGA